MEARIMMAIAITLLVIAAYNLFKRWHLAQARESGGLAVSQPTILYFQSDHCAACPTQSRFLEQVNTAWHGRVAIQKIDADREPDKASQFRVFTLPTTVLVDGRGNVQTINYGLTNAQKLASQLRNLIEIGE